MDKAKDIPRNICDKLCSLGRRLQLEVRMQGFYWEESKFGKREILGYVKVTIRIQLITWTAVKLAWPFRVILSQREANRAWEPYNNDLVIVVHYQM